MKNINADQLIELIKTDNHLMVLDVRTAGEVAGGMIEGAINHDIFSSDFPEKVNTLDKTRTYVVVCASGNRSATACRFMESNGFTVYNLVGGMSAWSGVMV